jgi:myo-inositol-1(or 4)-monophosphatase
VSHDFQALLQLACEAAAEGATVLESMFLRVRGRRLDVTTKKTAIDFVTEADRATEEIVVRRLRSSGIAIVAEEGSGGAPPAPGEAAWHVDPLDGTTNYAFGHPYHACSIGLVAGGLPVLGVVHAPALGVRFSGIAGEGGVRRDLFRGLEQPLGVSPFGAIDEVLLATGFPYDRRTSDDDNLSAYAALTKRAQGVLRCGSAALDLSLVADGTYGGFWERKLGTWDLAAGAALVRAAGGRISAFDGGPIVVSSGAIVASNGRIHDELLAAVRPHVPASLFGKPHG